MPADPAAPCPFEHTSVSSPGAGASSPVHDVVHRAEAFIAVLSADQRRHLQQDRSFATATTWSNLPEAVLDRGGRVGLRTGSLSDAQWATLHALLRSATAPAGYEEIRQHLDADDLLAMHGRAGWYGRDQFTIAILGRPSVTERWMLQFGGHHLALVLTYDAGRLVGTTPAFRGIEPFPTVTIDHRTSHPQRRLRDGMAALVTSLDPRQRDAARMASRHHDVLLGPSRDWAFPVMRQGIPGSALHTGQRELVLHAIRPWVDAVEIGTATDIMTRYAHELDDTCIAFAGSPALDRAGDYVRLDGPSVWIEFSMHPGGVFPDAHPHAIWRDRRTDYGGLRP